MNCQDVSGGGRLKIFRVNKKNSTYLTSPPLLPGIQYLSLKVHILQYLLCIGQTHHYPGPSSTKLSKGLTSGDHIYGNKAKGQQGISVRMFEIKNIRKHFRKYFDKIDFRMF